MKCGHKRENPLYIIVSMYAFLNMNNNMLVSDNSVMLLT